VQHICKSFSLSLTAIGQIDPNCFFCFSLLRKHKFFVVADEAYQLLNFEKLDVWSSTTSTGGQSSSNCQQLPAFDRAEIKPLFYHDDPEDPYGASDSKMHMGYQETMQNIRHCVTHLGPVGK